MRLCEQGRLQLEESLGAILPAFADSPYAAVTVEQLLAHRSGLPDYRPYFEDYAADALESLDSEKVQQDYLERIAREEPATASGTERIYSDLGFMVLQAVLEKLAVDKIRNLYIQEVVKPLTLKNSFYGPVDNFSGQVVATAQDPWCRRLLCGEVDDANAAVLGGAAGHAGVFTSLFDCHKFAQELVRAYRGMSSWLRSETVERFVGIERTLCLGWDRPSRPQSQAGRYFPERAVGHLAFTGCSLWIDLEQDVIAILLTNRVHPSRDNERIKDFRPKIHDALFQYYLS